MRSRTFLLLGVAVLAITAAGAAPNTAQAADKKPAKAATPKTAAPKTQGVQAGSAADRSFANPPAERPEAEVPAATPPRLTEAVAPPSVGSALKAADSYVDPRDTIQYRFQIRFTDGEIYNPWTLGNDKVRLRSYRGAQVDPKTPFLAPTITMRPGQTVRISLANQLFDLGPDGKPLPPKPCVHDDVNVPHCFNETNLHSHGLWVSPTGNSDNVLISINPGVTFDYEYNVPADHPAGTFWYHPHKHGSTALQVSSGMDGALIIKDDRVPTAVTPGDIDILLTDADNRAIADKVLLFQQVQYACFDKDGKIQTTDGKQPWVCYPGQVGEIRDYKQQFAPSANWINSGRFTSINGVVQPMIGGLKAGRFERWRLIHGGVREAVDFSIFPLKAGAPDFRAVKAADQAAWMTKYCETARPVPLFEIALDGLTRQAVRRAADTRLQPGYRADLVVNFPAGGRYCVVDAAAPAAGSPSQLPEAARVLAIAEVEDDPSIQGIDTEKALRDMMVAAAKRNIPAGPTQDKVIADLASLTLSAFVWHKTIDKAELNAPDQELVFNIVQTPKTTRFEVNGEPYDPARIDRKLKLGDVQEWHLTSDTASHPFHIHVNPFQVVSVKTKAGVDVTDPKGGSFDPDYAGMIDQWKDTLFVKPGLIVTTRTRYERYIGEFVLHCHILDHEDQGMMQNVSIGIPDGFGGIASAHAPAAKHEH